MDLSVIVPTFNEAQNIRSLLDSLTQALDGVDFEIWVVDDDSPDRTWNVVEAYGNPRVHVLRRTEDRGLATAVMAGWRKARGRYLAVIDGDGQHPPEALRRLYDRVVKGDVDIVLGTRKSAGGSTGDWILWRVFVSWVATQMAKVLFPFRLRGVSDPMSGLFCFDRKLIEGKALSPLGYKILLEVIVRGKPRGIAEVPYTFLERKVGASKMGSKQVLLYLVHLLKLRFLGPPKGLPPVLEARHSS